MENLKTLIKSLSPGEEKLVRHFYKLRGFGEYRKREQLFDALLYDQVKSEAALAGLAGYDATNSSFHNLKSRLKSDIVCVLLMQESSCKFNTQYAQAMFSCRRSLLTGEILLSRGVYQEGISLLRKAAKIAEKYELYAERIITEDALRNHYAGSNDIDELYSGTETIDDNYRLLGQMMSSKKKLYQTVFPQSGMFAEDAPHYGSEEMLNELEVIGNSSDSKRVSFYSKLSRLNLLHTSGDLPRAVNCALDLLQDVENNPVIMSAANQGGIHLELANMYLRMHEFDKSELHAQKALELFKKGMLNHMRAATLVFYAQVHSERYDVAATTLTEVLNSRCLLEPQYELLKQRLNLVAAWFAFAMNNVNESAKRFKNCGALVKEKGAWCHGYCILEILLLAEKGSVEAAGYKLDAFRKQIARAKKDANINRSLLIVAIMKQLVRSGNDYSETSRIASKEIVQLIDPAYGATWDPTGYEIVPFERMIGLNINTRMKPSRTEIN